MTGHRSPTRDERAATPAVSKALEASLVVLFVGFLATTLYGGFVPHHRADAAHALADRTASTAARTVEDAVPGRAASVSVTRRVDLPDRVHGDPYVVRVHGGVLTLDAPGLAVHVRLVLPHRVRAVTGVWHSTRRLRVRVSATRDSGLTVHLAEGST